MVSFLTDVVPRRYGHAAKAALISYAAAAEPPKTGVTYITARPLLPCGTSTGASGGSKAI